MPDFIVFIANAIASIFISLYSVNRIIFERYYIVYAKTKWQKLMFYIKELFQFLYVLIIIFLLLSTIPFIIHKINIIVLSTLFDCIFLFIDVLFFITSLFYLIYPEFDFYEMQKIGIEEYYNKNKNEDSFTGIESMKELEKKYLEYKNKQWFESSKNPIIRFIRDDPRSFMYFILSTIIAIICIFL